LTLLPSIHISPLRTIVCPKIAAPKSWCPEPSSPYTPNISPLRAAKLTPKSASFVKSLTSIATPFGAPGVFGYMSVRSRPTIVRISASRVAVFASSRPVTQPSRSTTTRSAMRKISSSLCEM